MVVHEAFCDALITAATQFGIYEIVLKRDMHTSLTSKARDLHDRVGTHA